MNAHDGPSGGLRGVVPADQRAVEGGAGHPQGGGDGGHGLAGLAHAAADADLVGGQGAGAPGVTATRESTLGS